MGIEFSRERVNAFRLEAQGLWPRGTGLAETMAGCGWLPPRESAYLALAARVPGYDRLALDRLVFERKFWMELTTIRGQSFLMPREMAAAAIRAPFPRGRDEANKVLEAAGISTPLRHSLEAAIEEVLSDGPLAPRDLRNLLQRDAGDVKALAEDPAVVSSVLTLMRLDGVVAWTNISGSLDVGLSVFALTSTILPDQDVRGMDPREALRQLCAFYFRVHGPASPADFGWWCGAGRAEAAEAFAAHSRSMVEVRVEDVPYPLYLPRSRHEDLLEADPPPFEPVSLIPWQDTWLSSHEGRVGRFLRREDMPKIFPSTALPAILVRGYVAGRWELSVASGEVELVWFRPPSEQVEELAKERAEEIGAFASLELTGSAPVSVSGPDGEIRVYS